MKSVKLIKPTQAELEVLRVLWDKGAVTVRQVHEELPREQETAYTTTLKIMQNMLEKGLLSRDESSRTHIYKAKVQEETMQKKLLGGFLSTAFGGSAKNLVMQVLGSQETTQDELNEIKELIAQIEGGVK